MHNSSDFRHGHEEALRPQRWQLSLPATAAASAALDAVDCISGFTAASLASSKGPHCLQLSVQVAVPASAALQSASVMHVTAFVASLLPAWHWTAHLVSTGVLRVWRRPQQRHPICCCCCCRCCYWHTRGALREGSDGPPVQRGVLDLPARNGCVVAGSAGTRKEQRRVGDRVVLGQHLQQTPDCMGLVGPCMWHVPDGALLLLTKTWLCMQCSALPTYVSEHKPVWCMHCKKSLKVVHDSADVSAKNSVMVLVSAVMQVDVLAAAADDAAGVAAPLVRCPAMRLQCHWCWRLQPKRRPSLRRDTDSNTTR